MAQNKEAITKKLNAAQALVNKYTAELEALDRATNIAKDTVVSFSFGRGEKVVTLQGKVVATGTAGNGVAVATVLVNEGTIDADIKRVPISGLTIVEGVAEPVVGAPVDAAPTAPAATGENAAATEQAADALNIPRDLEALVN